MPETDANTESPGTLRDLATHNRERLRPTNVHVVGYPELEPPRGIASAKRVANILADEDGEILHDDYGKLGEGDVAFVRGPILDHTEAHRELLTLAEVSRTRSLAGIVLYAQGVDPRTEKYLDARVYARDGLERVTALRQDQFDGETVEVEIDLV